MTKIGRGHRLQRQNLAMLKVLSIPPGVLVCRDTPTPVQVANLREEWAKYWQGAPTKLAILRDPDPIV